MKQFKKIQSLRLIAVNTLKLKEIKIITIIRQILNKKIYKKAPNQQ